MHLSPISCCCGPRDDFYASQTPSAADCLLVIEVADTSGDFDRQIKVPRYARGGVTELWLVDLDREVVVVYRDPSADAYQHMQLFHRGETVLVEALRGPSIDVAAIIA